MLCKDAAVQPRSLGQGEQRLEQADEQIGAITDKVRLGPGLHDGGVELMGWQMPTTTVWHLENRQSS